MNIDKERELFEAWASDGGTFPKAVDRHGDGYKLAQTQGYWMAWQARAALDAQKAAPSDEDVETLAKQFLRLHRKADCDTHAFLEGAQGFARALLSKYGAQSAPNSPESCASADDKGGALSPVAWRITYRKPTSPNGILDVTYHGHNCIADYREIDPNATVTPLYDSPTNEQDEGWGKEDFYEEVYDNLCIALREYIDSQQLPPSVTEATEYLLEYWLKNKANEQDARDAARYRWLRDESISDALGDGVLAPVVFNADDNFKHDDNALIGDKLDLEIDAAIAKQGKGV